MDYKPSHYFIFDTETGGLREQNPSLLTLDGILADSKLDIIKTISLKIKPNDGIYRVNGFAMGINGIDLAEHDKTAVRCLEAGEALENLFCNDGPWYDGNPSKANKIVPVGQYLEFDMHFLKKLPTVRWKWDEMLTRRGLCTAAVAQFLVLQGKLPPLDCSLKSLAGHFGFDYTGAHDSAFDAELTRKVLKKLLEL